METAKTPTSLLFKLSVAFFIFSLVTTIVVVGLLITRSSGKTCNYNGTTYSEGEAFKDDCNSCSCSDGEVKCTLMGCEGSNDEDIAYPESDYFDDDITEEDEFPGMDTDEQ